jgi:uncharacterized protein YbaR (Trm112 family)/SAM-dependent methyltransferase
MHADLLDILRCPFCGWRLELVRTSFHEAEGDRIASGLLACECCLFPVVDGIPVMHLHDSTKVAIAHLEAGRPDDALLTMAGVASAEDAGRFRTAAASASSTYRDLVDALGSGFEGGYFLYRFSDPTFVVADAVVRAVAGAVLRGGGRALDVCGGSGHLTRLLVPLSTPAPVMADLFFAKLWLARRFTAPGAIQVCCDANNPLPFARGAFDYAMCSDAFMFIWQKRQMIGEMFRAVHGSARGTVLINHTHNQLVWSPSHGQGLTPAGYRHLFETAPSRAFGERALFADVVAGETLDLTRTEDDATLNGEAALTLISTPVDDVWRRHRIEPPRSTGGEWRINPLYAVVEDGTTLRGTLRFPSEDYEYEYGACRQYLPESVAIEAADLHAVQAGAVPASMAELIRRRVVVELPKRYC